MSGFLGDIRDAFSKRDNGVMQLILINAIVFLVLLLFRVTLSLSEHEGLYAVLLDQLTLKASLRHVFYKPWTLLTYAFVHQDVLHILFNMLFLYWFGMLLQEYLSSRRLVSIYLLGSVAGGLVFVCLYNLIPHFRPMVESPNMGASGGVYAVMAAAATLVPNYSFHVLFLGPVRIKWIVLFWVVVSFAQIPGTNAGGNMTHLSGAALGFLYIQALRRGIDLGQPLETVGAGMKKLLGRPERPSMKVTQRSTTLPSYTAFAATATEDFPDEDEIDAILDKISKSGYESLSREEKQKLYKASQRQ